MPQTKVVFYREEDGTVPALDWLNSLSQKLQDKFAGRIERLEAMGYELRRPVADFLRDGIYELRVRRGRMNLNEKESFRATRNDTNRRCNHGKRKKADYRFCS